MSPRYPGKIRDGLATQYIDAKLPPWLANLAPTCSQVQTPSSEGPASSQTGPPFSPSLCTVPVFPFSPASLSPCRERIVIRSLPYARHSGRIIGPSLKKLTQSKHSFGSALCLPSLYSYLSSSLKLARATPTHLIPPSFLFFCPKVLHHDGLLLGVDSHVSILSPSCCQPTKTEDKQSVLLFL